MYYTIVFLNFSFLIFKKKKITFVDLYFVSSIFYYINAFIGNIYSLHSLRIPIPIEISNQTYLLLCLNQLIILLFYLIPKKRVTEVNVKNDTNYMSIIWALKVITLLLFLCAIYFTISMNLFTRIEFNKSELLENSSFIETYFKYGSFYFFVAGLLVWDKITFFWKILLFYPLLVTFLMGHRSFLVLSLIAAFIIYINEILYDGNLLMFLRKNRKMIFLVLLLIIFVYVIKGVSGAIFTGDFDLVKERLTTPSYYLDSFRMGESNVILNHVNNVVTYGLNINGNTYSVILTLMVPFVGRYFQVNSFNSFLQAAYYPDYRLGSLGNSFLAEAYSQGSFLLVAIIVILLISFSNFLFNLSISKRTSLFTKTWAMTVGIECAFYIHRNSLYTFFVRLRVYIYLTVLFFIVYLIVTILKNTIFSKEIRR